METQRWLCTAVVPDMRLEHRVEITAVVEAGSVREALREFDDILDAVRHAEKWEITKVYDI